MVDLETVNQHRRWVQTLSHMSLINRLSQKSAEVGSLAVHRELGAAQRSADEKAIILVGNWLQEMQPFDESHCKETLISFSTGFISKSNDGINPEKAEEIGKHIQKNLDGKPPIKI